MLADSKRVNSIQKFENNSKKDYITLNYETLFFDIHCPNTKQPHFLMKL